MSEIGEPRVESDNIDMKRNVADVDVPSRDPKRLRWALRLLPLIVVLVGIVTIVFLVSDSDDSGSSNSGGVTEPDGYIEGTVDSFERSNVRGSLGENDDIDWTVVGHGWSIRDESAVIGRPNPNASIAVAEVADPVTGIQVQMNTVTDFAGVAFGYQDEDNYFALTAAPGYGTWGFWRISGGEWVFMNAVGLTALADGTIVGVQVDDGSAQAYINGEATGDPVSVAGSFGTKGGLVANGRESVGARFDNVVVRTEAQE